MNVRGLPSMIVNRLRRESIYNTAQYWDSKAEGFKGDAVSMWPNNHLNALYHREQLSLFERFLPEVKGRRILDAGCGTGRLSRYLAARGADVLGLDFSAKSIAIAESLSEDSNPRYQIGSIFDFEAVSPFDVVVSWGSVAVACRTRGELGTALSRFRRALGPEGRMLLLEPIHRGFLHRVLDLDLAGFVAETEGAGFEVLETEEVHYWPARLLLAYAALPERLTRAGYRAGQTLMRIAERGGDYKAIWARPAATR